MGNCQGNGNKTYTNCPGDSDSTEVDESHGGSFGGGCKCAETAYPDNLPCDCNNKLDSEVFDATRDKTQNEGTGHDTCTLLNPKNADIGVIARSSIYVLCEDGPVSVDGIDKRTSYKHGNAEKIETAHIFEENRREHLVWYFGENFPESEKNQNDNSENLILVRFPKEIGTIVTSTLAVFQA